MRALTRLTPLSTQLAMLIELFLGVILGLYDPLWHVEWPTKVHEGSGGVLDGLSAVGGRYGGSNGHLAVDMCLKPRAAYPLGVRGPCFAGLQWSDLTPDEPF